jgi:hypothetical protein
MGIGSIPTLSFLPIRRVFMPSKKTLAAETPTA